MPIQNLNFLPLKARQSRSGGYYRLQRMGQLAKALLTEFLLELWRQLRRWQQKRIALAQLHALDDAALKDIGLHRSGIEAAVEKSFVNPNPQKRRDSADEPHLYPQRTGVAA